MKILFVAALISAMVSPVTTFSQGTDSIHTLNVYRNKVYGFSFEVPYGINLYTSANPGPLASRINDENPIYLVNPDFTEENVNVKVASPVLQSDLSEFKRSLDEEPNMPLPEFKNISVGYIQIGKNKDMRAVEHIFIMKGNILGKLRQVIFSYKGRGYTFTCATAIERFDSANETFFSKIFDNMEFQKR